MANFICTGLDMATFTTADLDSFTWKTYDLANLVISSADGIAELPNTIENSPPASEPTRFDMYGIC